MTDSKSGSDEVTRAPEELARIVEAVLLASDQPLSFERLQAVFEDGGAPSRTAIRAALERIAEQRVDSAVELTEVASGWRLQVREAYAPWVSRLWREKPQRYSRALLETLAIICYRQPITRGEIEEIRGVSLSANIVRTLLERGWVRELGHREVPGRPVLLGTTRQFLDDYNLKSLDQLPALPEIKDLDALHAALARLDPEFKPPAGDDEGAPEAGDTSAADAETGSLASPPEPDAAQPTAVEAEPMDGKPVDASDDADPDRDDRPTRLPT